MTKAIFSLQSFLLGVCFVTQVRAEELRVYVFESPPIVSSAQGRPSGYVIDILNKVMEKEERKSGISVVPFQRGLSLAQRQPNVMMAYVARTDEREKSFKWAGPIFANRSFLYRKRNSNIQLDSIEDARKVRSIVAVRGSSTYEHLKRLGFTNIVAVASQLDALRMLVHGSADLMTASEVFVVGPSHAKQSNDVVAENTDVMLKEYAMYLAFSRDIPDATVARWQTALDKLWQSGELTEMAKKHMGDGFKLR